MHHVNENVNLFFQRLFSDIPRLHLWDWSKQKHQEINVNVFILFILFTNPSARAGYDTRSIFKWSLTGFNNVFMADHLNRFSCKENQVTTYSDTTKNFTSRDSSLSFLTLPLALPIVSWLIPQMQHSDWLTLFNYCLLISFMAFLNLSLSLKKPTFSWLCRKLM